MISTTQVWENVLIEIQARVTAFAYESWIEGLVPVCIYEDNVVLLCENSAKNESWKKDISTLFPKVVKSNASQRGCAVYFRGRKGKIRKIR